MFLRSSRGTAKNIAGQCRHVRSRKVKSCQIRKNDDENSNCFGEKVNVETAGRTEKAVGKQETVTGKPV